MYLSNLRNLRTGNTLPIISESFAPDIPAGEGYGYVPRDYNQIPLGSLPYTTAFDIPVIPSSDWPALLEAQEASRARMSDLRAFHNLKSSNQNPLPYCWIHGCVNPMRLLRAQQGQPYSDLEPTSAGALIKNFRSVGGNTPESVRHLAEKGVTTTEFWPRNRLDRSLNTEESRKNAYAHRLLEWWELRPNNFDQLATCLLLGFAPTIGLMWWSHMIVALDLVRLGRNEYGVRIWNSWGDGYGENGEAVLPESKSIAFDQMCARTITHNGNPSHPRPLKTSQDNNLLSYLTQVRATYGNAAPIARAA
jgi:hypothetical protein